LSLTISHLPREVPNPKDTLIAVLVTLKAAPVAVKFQVIAANFNESVCTTDSRPSVLVYVAMPLSDHTMLSLEILYNTIYKEGVKYAVSAYNISVKACNKLPNRLAVLRYYLSIYPLII
jgi:hypothetical protein